VLAARLRDDTRDLDRIAARVARGLAARTRATDEPDLVLDSMALNLHDYYSGLERILLGIASDLDRSVPNGADWHRVLLQQMTITVPGLRPQVLPDDVAAGAAELLRFRHVVRHNYAFVLEEERVTRLAQRLPVQHQAVQAALATFITYLDRLASDAESGQLGDH
jgi:hypothetical protein